jgi:hypothetical protein
MTPTRLGPNAVRRRMALSRQMLNRRLPVVPDDDIRKPLVLREADRRPLTDGEQVQALSHDVAQLRARALDYVEEQIRHAKQAVAIKRQDLQNAWTTLQELEIERRQILGEQAARRGDETERFDVVD